MFSGVCKTLLRTFKGTVGTSSISPQWSAREVEAWREVGKGLDKLVKRANSVLDGLIDWERG